jgi:hypothetical protein
MKAPIQIKADILKTLMVEDRNEVRTIRASIFNGIYLLTLFSFALSAFVIEKPTAARFVPLAMITDGIVIAFVWVAYGLLKLALVHARRALKKRQELIKKLSDDDDTQLDPFPDASQEKPDIKDGELWWLPIFATVAVALKAIALHAAAG